MKKIQTLVDQCGEVFAVGPVTLRCVLKAGHKGNHTASLPPVPYKPVTHPAKGHRLLSIYDRETGEPIR